MHKYSGDLIIILLMQAEEFKSEEGQYRWWFGLWAMRVCSSGWRLRWGGR